MDERKQHLELVATGLTQAYYSVHPGGSPDYREIFETYKFFLDALVEQDKLPPGHTPLRAGDTLAPYGDDEPGTRP
jgi:hypothetical protein